MQPLPFLLMFLLLQLQPSASRLIRVPPSDWGIKVYVQISSPVLRAISASAGTFIYEGTLNWFWRDDSLRTYYGSEDFINSAYIFADTFAPSTLYGTYNNTNRVVRQ